jgi:hypothetical protein
MKEKINILLYSFPVQLIVLHFKKNVLMMGLWFILILFISGGIGRTFGLKYLFLDPEYLDFVGFWSFFFIGFGFAGFVTAWNISTYLLHSTRFPFIASLHRPFIQFSINNSLFPILFIIFYFYKIITFQLRNNCEWSILLGYLVGFVGGFSMALVLFVFYFRLTNRDIFTYDIRIRYNTPKFLRGLVAQRDKEQERGNIDRYKWRVDFYIDGKWRLRRVRSVAHYNQKLLTNIFNQHHKNATVLQFVTIVALISLGFLMDYEVFRIPAGASVLVLFAMLTSVLGALWYWLRGWHVVALLALVFVINFITVGYGGKYKNKAYGLKYNVERSIYHYDTIANIQNAVTIQADIDSTLTILNNWRSKFGTEKPKLILVGVSGGGLRASVWSMRVLQYTDSIFNNEITKQTSLISGASGGMIGAAYYRELYYQQLENQLDKQLYDRFYTTKIAKDLQNAILFSIAVNDLFLPWSRFTDSGENYPKDRGYIFERQLNKNTDNLLDNRLSYYRNLEQSGKIPMLLLSPVIANDGKKLIISPQGKSFLTAPKSAHHHPQKVEFDGIDFQHFFKNQSPLNLKFTAALRMNATYPYILPNVHLPSSPPIEVVDAGWRDNVGVDIPIRFAHVFKDWIQANTSGVVFIQIRASEKIDTLEVLNSDQGIIRSVINPLGLVGQFMGMQDFNQDAALDYIRAIYGDFPMDIIQFMYRPSQLNEKASMSFHLTEKEKEDIINAIYLNENQASLERLRLLISGK